MIDTQLNAHLAKCCTTAAFGYAEAAGQAYFEMTSRVLDAWSAALDASFPKAEEKPRSWYRHPSTPVATQVWSAPTSVRTAAAPGQNPFAPNPFAANPFAMNPFAMNPFAAGSFASGWSGPRNANAAVESWQAMMLAPWTLSPAAWPFAFAMVASGVPRGVAWPAAEANAAAADAARTAAAVVQRTFSSYHSDSGHASAQIHSLPLAAAAMALPLGAEMLSWWPWAVLPSATVGA